MTDQEGPQIRGIQRREVDGAINQPDYTRGVRPCQKSRENVKLRIVIELGEQLPHVQKHIFPVGFCSRNDGHILGTRFRDLATKPM